MEASMVKRYRFFKDNAGYSTPPGRAACALNLARAEAWAEDNDVTFTWEYEDEHPSRVFGDDWCKDCAHLDGCSKRFRSVRDGCPHIDSHEHTAEACRASVETDHGTFDASIGMVTDASNSYRRVVEAELASQIMAEVEGTRDMYARQWAD